VESAGEYDYIIVGAGTAGCVLANRLTQDKHIEVLLIEAGARDDYLWIHIPVGYLHCIGNPRTDWLFNTEPDPGLNGRALIYPRGKVLGGSSSINGMIYMRGQQQDYERWADSCGDDSWRWNQVLPLFKKSEDHYRGASDVHGAGGEWRVEKQRLSWKILDAFRDAAAEAGIEKVDDFNTGDNAGSSYFEVNQRRGIRLNTAKAFLKPAAQRPNLTIMTGCHVERLLLETTDAGPVCRGVQFTGGGKAHTAKARRETLLAAGAIGSPHILQLSGIGDGAHLQRHGVTPLVELPGVGENLQDHLQLRMVYKVQGVKTLNTSAASWFGKMKIGLEYAFLRSGPMSMAPSQLGAFAKSHAPDRRFSLAGALPARGIQAGHSLPHRGRAGRSRRPDRHDDFSSRRHLQDGHTGRPASRGRQPAAGARGRGLARGRRLDHAVYNLGQYELTDPHDCRESGEHDQNRTRSTVSCSFMHNGSALAAQLCAAAQAPLVLCKELNCVIFAK
jgi:choline dehydrogenase